MLSKYVLNSNWTALSGTYKFDSNVDLFNTNLNVTGNLNLIYTSYLSELKDYTNNNYSLAFLTRSTTISSIFNNTIPKLNTNKQLCLLANQMQDQFITEDTTFLNLNNNVLQRNKITNLSDSNYFEIDFLNSNELILLNSRKRINYYVCVDDINIALSTIVKSDLENLTDFELQKIKLNYIYDEEKRTIVIYRKVKENVYVISALGTDRINLRLSYLRDLTVFDTFTVLRLKDLPGLKNNLSLVRYKVTINKNNIDVSNSLPVSNNFLAHVEYENIKGGTSNVNFLALKNQFNILEKNITIDSKFNLRTYESLLGGGNREEGYGNLTLNYITKYFPLTLKADKTTWFHIPNNNSDFRPNINDTLFVKSGAIAGSAPIFSDKIFKKAANYSTTSNMGHVKDEEQSGTWLCSWLSGGRNNAVWMDRFFNESSFTPFEALKFKSNVDYTPKYFGKRGEGITDIPSQLTLEPNAWYAYSRIGKLTIDKIVNGMSKNFLVDRLDSFKNKNKVDINLSTDSDGDPIYVFDGNSIGSFSTKNNVNFNTISLAFFATRNDWNVRNEFQLLGNYIDNGFGLFNNYYVNPVNYYINDKLLTLFNNRGKEILSIDCSLFLSNNNFSIAGLFKRDFNENFHIITTNNDILEFNSNGTLVDILSVQKTGSAKIVSITNNTNYGAILYENNDILIFDLYSNVYRRPFKTVTVSSGNTPNIIIDVFDTVYVFNGVSPIFKGINLYYKDTNSNSIKVFNTSTNGLSTYITTSDRIMGFNFDKKQNTYVLLKDKLTQYDVFGAYFSAYPINTELQRITSYGVGFQNLYSKEQCNILLVDSQYKNYIYNFTDKELIKIDNILNKDLDQFNKLYQYDFDFCSSSYIQTNISNLYPLPNYTFKIKLFNQFNYEDVTILKSEILGENLNTGTHHFAFVIDVAGGIFKTYIDGLIYRTIKFKPLKYSFANLFSNDVTLGAIPFHGGVYYNDFYKSPDLPLLNDFTIEKLRLYNTPLTDDEVRLLYFQKYNPKDLVVDVEMGERNYLDTITRTFRHKMQGSKSNLINLVINDSLINDRETQKKYEVLILQKLRETLPAYVKINTIKWVNSKSNSESMLTGTFNVRNTLTNNIE